MKRFILSNNVIQLGTMFGIFREKEGAVAISNTIFEIYLYNYFSSIVKVFHFPITLLSVLNCNNQRLLGTRLFPIYMLQLHSGYFFSSYHSFFTIPTSSTSKK